MILDRKYVKLSFELDGKIIKEQMVATYKVPEYMDRWKKMIGNLDKRDFKIYVTIQSAMVERQIKRKFQFFNKIKSSTITNEQTEAIADHIG